MARLNSYHWPACNKSWNVCGATGCIMSGPIFTCACSRCKNLLDVSVKMDGDVISSNLKKIRRHWCDRKGGLSVWVSTNLCCPKCGKNGMNFIPDIAIAD